jgi:hypothetical protein
MDSRTLIWVALAGPQAMAYALRAASQAPFINSEEGLRAQARVWGELVEILDRIASGTTQYFKLRSCE